MISPVLAHTAPKALLRQCYKKPIHCRGLAAAASGTFSYETSEAAGVKVGSRNIPGPTAYLALVAKAGTRYQPLPGLTEALEQYAFKSTQRRSALRITRETELLGSQLVATHSRENLLIGAKFLRDDLPYFVELLAEVASQTKYTRHELQEEVAPVIKLSQKTLLGNTRELAIDSAHGIAFHRGLGTPLHPTSNMPLTTYLNHERVRAFSQRAYAKNNFAIVANGVSHEDLSKWVQEFFWDWKTSTSEVDLPPVENKPSKYYGGEERIAHGSGDSMIIAFPGSGSFTGSAYKPEISVLAALLGGQSSIKWSPGFSLLARATAAFPQAHIKTFHSTYSDAGLLQISISGNADHIRPASHEVVKTLNSVAAGNFSQQDFKKAVAAAKFNTLDAGQDIREGLELAGGGLVNGGNVYQIDEVAKSIERVTEEQLKKTSKSLLSGKATVSAVGDLFVLPFAEEIGLNV